jgi:hypothetical protein
LNETKNQAKKGDFNNSGDCRGGQFSTGDISGGGEYGDRGGRVVGIAGRQRGSGGGGGGGMGFGIQSPATECTVTYCSIEEYQRFLGFLCAFYSFPILCVQYALPYSPKFPDT